jgi:NTP pyrophosphatase (non-canonical NTP hydrolase)
VNIREEELKKLQDKINEYWDAEICEVDVANYIINKSEKLISEVRRLNDALKGAAIVTNQAKGLLEENQRLTKELEHIKEKTKHGQAYTVEAVGYVNIREEVQWFSQEMEKKLIENDHKAHWSDLPIAYLEMRLKQEVVELEEAIMDFHLGKGSVDQITKEAADVGNFAMMIADAYSHRPRTPGRCDRGKVRQI